METIASDGLVANFNEINQTFAFNSVNSALHQVAESQALNGIKLTQSANKLLVRSV